ncbi:helix-turn-helix domain-containing protein [Haloferax larsenii]|uniref:helix-turn-helix domain-containing protein n=1 Tax=Haloferax larsenii TaxID=302484 RepID=UPI00067767C2|nr:helix-turn-helix domain-containing protein [Haloferax larsenii]
MSTVATLRVPASTFILDDALARHPSIEARLLRSVQVDSASTTPSIWVRGNDATLVEPALRSDPSVSAHSKVFSSKQGGVYRTGFEALSDPILRLFADTRLTVVDSYAQGSEWVFRVLAEKRESLRALTETWEQNGLTHTVERISDCTEAADPSRFGLTEAQHRTLVTAFREGYYEVPRDSDITGVANILGISHQATSQRLRRGHERLVQNALVQRLTPEFPF